MMVFGIAVIEFRTQEIMYSTIYDYLSDFKTPDETIDDRRSVQNKILSDLVRRLRKEVNFHVAVNTNDSAFVAENKLAATGVFNCGILNAEKVILWRLFSGVIYVIIVEKSENRLLASRVLLQLSQTTVDFLPKTASLANEIRSHIELVLMIFNTYLPNGQLLFLNSRVLQQMKREIRK